MTVLVGSVERYVIQTVPGTQVVGLRVITVEVGIVHVVIEVVVGNEDESEGAVLIRGTHGGKAVFLRRPNGIIAAHAVGVFGIELDAGH